MVQAHLLTHSVSWLAALSPPYFHAAHVACSHSMFDVRLRMSEGRVRMCQTRKFNFPPAVFIIFWFHIHFYSALVFSPASFELSFLERKELHTSQGWGRLGRLPFRGFLDRLLLSLATFTLNQLWSFLSGRKNMLIRIEILNLFILESIIGRKFLRLTLRHKEKVEE